MPQALHRVARLGMACAACSMARLSSFRLFWDDRQQVRTPSGSAGGGRGSSEQRYVKLAGRSRVRSPTRTSERPGKRVLHLSHPELVRRPQQREEQPHTHRAECIGPTTTVA
jgi:hypothetical protein